MEHPQTLPWGSYSEGIRSLSNHLSKNLGSKTSSNCAQTLSWPLPVQHQIKWVWPSYWIPMLCFASCSALLNVISFFVCFYPLSPSLSFSLVPLRFLSQVCFIIVYCYILSCPFFPLLSLGTWKQSNSLVSATMFDMLVCHGFLSKSKKKDGRLGCSGQQGSPWVWWLESWDTFVFMSVISAFKCY